MNKYTVTFRAWTRDTGSPGHKATRRLRKTYPDGDVTVSYYGCRDFYVKFNEIISVDPA